MRLKIWYKLFVLTPVHLGIRDQKNDQKTLTRGYPTKKLGYFSGCRTQKCRGVKECGLYRFSSRFLSRKMRYKTLFNFHAFSSTSYPKNRLKIPIRNSKLLIYIIRGKLALHKIFRNPDENLQNPSSTYG